MDINEILNMGSASYGPQVADPTQDMGKEEFITLLITQLKNQDPFEPVENSEFISQLAQFTSLQEAEDTNANLQLLAEYQRQSFQLMSLTEGASLIGKEVTYYEPVSETQLVGTVEGLQVAGGRVYLQIGDNAIPMELIMEVKDSQEA